MRDNTRAVQGLFNTSVADCQISVTNMAERQPADCLRLVADAFDYLDDTGIERKSHRQALARAGRLAIKKLAEGGAP